MKIYTTLQNEKGKKEGMGGNEYLDIDIMVGNRVFEQLTLRYTDELSINYPKQSGWALFNQCDEIIAWLADECKDCQAINKFLPNLYGKGRCEEHAKGKKQKSI